MASLWTTTMILVITAVLIPLCDSTYKLCCDPNCDTPISHGRTRSRKTDRKEGHLTFPANAKLTIWAKHYNSQPNVWEAEMYGRWGLVNENDIEESMIHCSVPQHWVPVNSVTNGVDGSDLPLPLIVSSKELVVPTISTVSEISIQVPKFDDSGLNKEDNIGDHLLDEKDDIKSASFNGNLDEVKKGDFTNSLEKYETDLSSVMNTETISSDVDMPPSVSISMIFEENYQSTSVTSASTLSESNHEIYSTTLSDSSFEEDFQTSKDQLPQTSQAQPVSIQKEYHTHLSEITQTYSSSVPFYNKNEQKEQTLVSDNKGYEERGLKEQIFMSDSKRHNLLHDEDDYSHNEPKFSLNKHKEHYSQGKHEKYYPLPNEHSAELNELDSQGGTDSSPNKHTESDLSLNAYDIQTGHNSLPDEHKFKQDLGKLGVEDQHMHNEDTFHSENSFSENSHDSQTEYSLHKEHLDQSNSSISSWENNEYWNQSTKTEGVFSEDQSSFHEIYSTNVKLQSSDDQVQYTSVIFPKQEEIFSKRKDSAVSAEHSHDEDFSSKVSLLIDPASTEQFQAAEYFLSAVSDTSPLVFSDEVSSMNPQDTSFKMSAVSDNQLHVQSPIKIDSKYSSFLLQAVNMFLPLSVESWLLSKGVDITLIGICVSLFVVTVPILCSCCNTQHKVSKIKKELKSMQDHKRNMESHIKKLKDEKDEIESYSRNLQIQLNDYQSKLKDEKEGNWDLENIRRNLEEEKRTQEELYKSLQNEYNRNIESLKLELQNSSQQLQSFMEEKYNLQLQIASIETLLKDAVQKRDESEAAKVQFEQDIYETRQQLEHITLEYDELRKEKEKVSQDHSEVCNDLESTRQELERANEMISDGSKEIVVLRECIQNLSELDVEEKSVQMEKIKSLLDSTKVRTELKVITEERNQLQLEIQTQALLVDQLQTQNVSLHQEVADIHSAKENILHQYQETQIKLKAITEYFEEKESHLHRRIGEEEIIRQRVESREAYAKERVDLIEQEREKEREELKELRQQMGDIEKGLMQQVITNERRAEDALSQLRRTEQELRSANKEITLLKKQIADENISNNTSASIHGIPPLDSASYLRPQPLMVMSRPRGQPRQYRPRAPLPPQSSSPILLDGKGFQDKNALSRPPPPGMESRESYQRRNFPPALPRPGLGHSRSPVSFGRQGGDQSFERPGFHSDRPPIPGDMGFFPPRAYPPRNYIPPDRSRPPSEPPHEDIHIRGRPPSNPPVADAGVLFTSSVRVPVQHKRSNPVLQPSQSLSLDNSKENDQESFS